MIAEAPTILFDGVCNYCNSMVNFVIRQDKSQIFRFGTLQSASAQELLEHYHLPIKDFDSFVFIETGKAWVKSTAALKVMKHLSWYWQWTQLFWIVPKFIRDGVYSFVAKNRYKWFGKKESCMIPSAELRSRFLS